MKQLNGSPQSPDGPTLGLDTDVIVRGNTAKALFQEGYRFCVRYLSRNTQSPQDLSYDEACQILGAGLALMPVQHVAEPGWHPGASLGEQYGRAAAVNAHAVGFPPGVNVWCDLEGCSTAASAADVIAYCGAWHAQVAAGGFLPGLYVGANAVLSGTQLYENLPFRHYWKSESTVPAVPTRGYQMMQRPVAGLVCGIAIDANSTQQDELGGQVVWLAPLRGAAG